jgi:hypothetical protein
VSEQEASESPEPRAERSLSGGEDERLAESRHPDHYRKIQKQLSPREELFFILRKWEEGFGTLNLGSQN